VRQGITLLLLLALVAGAAAAGEGAPPAFPHEFYGSVTIDGVLAPAGTVITGVIGGRECESVTTTVPGEYGSSSRHKGANLLVWGSAEQAGETITFLVAGTAAKETVTYTPGERTRLDLTVGGSGGSSGGGGSGNSGGSSGGSPAAPVSSSTPERPAAPATHVGKASLPTTPAGEVTASTTIRAADGTGTLQIPEGTTARAADGGPLGEVTVARAAEVPAAPPGTTVAIALTCGPAGAAFDPPVSLTYTLSAEEWAKIGDPATLSVLWYNPASKAWQEVPATVDPATRTVTAAISHFSIYALAWTPTPPAETTTAPAATTPPDETRPDPGPQQSAKETPWALIAAGTLVVAGGLAAGWCYRKKR